MLDIQGISSGGKRVTPPLGIPLGSSQSQPEADLPLIFVNFQKAQARDVSGSLELKPRFLLDVSAPGHELEEGCRWGGQGAGTVLLCCLSS